VQVLLLLEYCAAGSLAHVLKQVPGQKLPPADIAIVVMQVGERHSNYTTTHPQVLEGLAFC
jgi:hypothetical protein